MLLTFPLYWYWRAVYLSRIGCKIIVSSFSHKRKQQDTSCIGKARATWCRPHPQSMFIVSRHSCATNMYVDVSMAACTMVKMLFDVNEGKSKSGRFFVVLRVTIKMNSYHLSYVETVLKNGGQTKKSSSSPSSSTFTLRPSIPDTPLSKNNQACFGPPPKQVHS